MSLVLIKAQARQVIMIIEDRIEANVTIWRERMNRLIKEHGDYVISNVTVAQICSGIRGVPIQISDISYVDPSSGLRYRSYTINEVLNLMLKEIYSSFF